MKVSNFFTLASLAVVSQAATNEPCVGEGGAAGKFSRFQHIPSPHSSQPLPLLPLPANTARGVCVATSACSEAGGTSIAGACTGDAADVQCCTKTKCDNGASGNCRWQSDCDGEAVAGQCPGPAQMTCCSSDAQGFGGYDPPKVPEVSDACKAVSVEGAQKILEEFPGRVREVFCTRDCEDGNSSDHCTGKAMDMMCADGGGVCGSLSSQGSLARGLCTGISYPLSLTLLTYNRFLPRRVAKSPSG